MSEKRPAPDRDNPTPVPEKGGSCSFSADTQVLTEDGYREIASLSPDGPAVWSRNDRTGEMGWQSVTAAYPNRYEETVYLTIRDLSSGAEQTITSNRIHPFFVVPGQTKNTAQLIAATPQRALSEGHTYRGPIAGGRWLDAADLRTGDRLLNADASWASVTSVCVEQKPLLAYNIIVAQTETYFVRGRSNDRGPAVWVHNCNKLNSSEKRALIEMAKRDKRTGMTKDDMEAYKQLNRELKDPFPIDKVRGPESHPTARQPSSRREHGHVGPVGHIPIVRK